MIRTFKDLKEFKENTGLDVGDVLPIRVKQDIFPKELYFHKWLITELNFSNKTVGLGTHIYPLEDLCKNFEFQKDNKWLPFGIEEPEEQIEPHKFKVGKKYYDYGFEKFEVLINAKYKDPADNKVKVILNGATISEVFTDNEGNERATILDDIVKAEDEVNEDA